MKCPSCGNVNLTMSERQGIEIDYCPECRGVWLDRGELDKIIDRSLQSTGDHAVPPSPSQGYPDQRPPQRDPYRSGSYKKKKREGFLSELFDFD
jgi:Zn-finger nucleic acid-binding protein